MRADTSETLDHSNWEWADLDGKRLVWTNAGRLHAAHLKKSGLVNEEVLRDFNDMTFTPLAAPY